MQNIWNIAQFMTAWVNEWCCWFLGGFDNSLCALVVLVAAGEISGIICAYVDHKLSQKFWIKTIYKVLLIFVMIGVANILDIWVFYSEKVLRSASTFFYLSKEGIFLIENAEHLGVPIPEPLRQAIRQLQDYKKNDPKRSNDDSKIIPPYKSHLRSKTGTFMK